MAEGAAGLRRRIGLLTVGTSAVKTSQIVVTVMLVHALSDAAWNAVALALSVYLAAMTLGSLNLQQGLVFFLPLTDPRLHRSLVGRTAGMLGAIGAAFAAVFGVVALAGGGVGTMSPRAALLVAAAIALELPTVCAPALFVCRGRFAAGAAWDVTMTAVQVGAMVVPAAAGHGAGAVLAGLALAAAVRLVGFVVVVGALTSPGTAATASLLARQIVYCVPLGLTMAVGVLTRSIDKWLIAWRAPGRLGVYVVAAQEIPVLSVLPYAGGAAVAVELVRRFSANELGAAHRLWAAQAALMSSIVVPISMFLVAAAPELFALLFPPDYATGVFAFRCFTLITLHRVTEYGLVLRAADRTARLVAASVFLLAANAALATIGAVLGGIDGVAVGCLVAFALGWLFMLRLVGDAFGRPWWAAFPWAPWLRSVLLGAIALAASLAGAAPVGPAPARLAVKALLFVPFAALGVRLARGSFEPDEHGQQRAGRRLGARRRDPDLARQ